jgi:hypothetical protein
MNKRGTRKLTLRREALLILNSATLGHVRGGTVIVAETDPATAPQTDTDKGGTVRPMLQTRYCL